MRGIFLISKASYFEQIIFGLIIGFGLMALPIGPGVTTTRIALILCIVSVIILAIAKNLIYRLEINLPVFLALTLLILSMFAHFSSSLINQSESLSIFSWPLYIMLFVAIRLIGKSIAINRTVLLVAVITIYSAFIPILYDVVFAFNSFGVGNNFRAEVDQSFPMGLNEFCYQLLLAGTTILILADVSSIELKQDLKILAFGLCFAAILIGALTVSRQTIAFTLIFLIALFFSFSRINKLFWTPLMLIFCVLVFGDVLVSFFELGYADLLSKRLSILLTGETNTSDDTRLSLLLLGLKLSFEGGFFGLGAGGFFQLTGKGTENGYLDLLVDIGFVPGLIIALLYLGLCASIAHRVWVHGTKYKALWMPWLFMILVGPLFNEVLRDPVTWMSLALLSSGTNRTLIVPLREGRV